MLPSRELQRPSKKNRIKTFMRKLFSSNSRPSSSRNSSAHDLPPIASASTTSSSRPANVSSTSPDHTSKTSSPSALPIPTLIDSLSPTNQAAGNVTSHLSPQTIKRATTPFSTATSEPLTPPKGHINRPDVTPLPAPDHEPSSMTKPPLSLLWHGLEQLLKRIEPCLDGTPAKVPVSVLNIIIAIGKAVVDNKSALAERVVQSMNRLNVVNEALLQVEPDGAVGRAMLTFAKKLVDEAVMLNGMSSSRVWKRIIENEEDAKKVEESFKRLDEHTKDFQLEIILGIERNTSDLSDGVTRLQLENLPRAREALYNAAIGDSITLAREPCTVGTRVFILDHIYHWAQDSSSSSPRIFWLTGDAGSGKSTIAYTVAAHFDDKTKSEAQKILRANFFCSRQFEKTRRRENIIPTIVYQLAHRSRSYARALLGGNKFRSADVLSDQMKDLLVDPWRQSANERPSELPPYLVVIDALDEIDGQGGPGFLHELLTAVDGGQLQGLKFLITSRPHHELASLCATFSSDAVCRLYDVPMDTVKADILAYLKVKLPDLQDEPQLGYLAEKADGLFIYAATVVRYIKPRDMMGKREQVRLMDKVSDPTSLISSMTLVDKLYQQILQEAFSGLEKELLDDRLKIFHTFFCAVERVSPSVAASLTFDTEMEDMASFIVSDLHAVLYLNEGRVFWYHASFQDFIFSKTRSRFTISGHDVDMSCDVATHNAVLTRRCFQIMMAKIRFNICDLPSSFLLDSEVPELDQLIEKNIDIVLKYCSRYWAQHLGRAAANDYDDLRTCIQNFLVLHVLFWIEAMNLLGLKLECSPMLQQAREWILECNGCPSDLTQDITEASNFATYFTGSPAALSTPHIYISSLATWSRNSTMSQKWGSHFSHVPSFTITKGVNTIPLMTIPISPRTRCVAFSTDGTRIVSGSSDDSVRVWNALTGAELKMLNAHTDKVVSVAFSDDGTRIVSGSRDKSMRVWDASTGAELKTLNGHTDYVLSVAFSTDGTRIVSGSRDRSMRVWDASMGVELKTLNGHTDEVRSVAFSSNGTRIVSGSGDRSVRVWDASTGAALKTLNGHTRIVLSVAFSSDGTRIVSGSYDGSVRVWDASMGTELKTLNHHGGHYSVAFSTDGASIVSGSDDGSVWVWDASTGAALKTLNGHTDYVLSVAFSGDGTRIVSGSHDDSVRVWDASTGAGLKTLNGHTDKVLSVAFSSDGTRIISSSRDDSVRVWDASTGAELKTLNGHTDKVLSIAVSSDGTSIVSGSSDRSVRVWDASTGEVLKTLNGHTETVLSVAFSGDGTRIVSGSRDRSMRVWDVSTGAELKMLNGHIDDVLSVAFSSDGTQIVSASSDESVRVWDALTGVELISVHVGMFYVQSVAFSRDGTRIISGSLDYSVRVWDVSTGELMMLDGHTDTVWSIAVSSDGTRIVSSSGDKSVRVWDASTGAELMSLNGHTDDVLSVAFSSDGTQIVSGSKDNSVRVWDLKDDGHHWEFTPQNWILSLPDQDRLMWVPSDIRALLYHPHNSLIISRKGSATVDFVSFKIGTVWAECYTPYLA